MVIEYLIEGISGKFKVILMYLKQKDCFKDNLFFECWKNIREFEKEIEKSHYKIINKKVIEDV